MVCQGRSLCFTDSAKIMAYVSVIDAAQQGVKMILSWAAGKYTAVVKGIFHGNPTGLRRLMTIILSNHA